MKSDSADLLPITEQDNPRSSNLSSLTPAGIIRLMNEEDGHVAAAVSGVLPQVDEAIAGIVAKLAGGGRLFYIGTGTSGRLGVLDASECPPTLECTRFGSGDYRGGV